VNKKKDKRRSMHVKQRKTEPLKNRTRVFSLLVLVLVFLFLNYIWKIENIKFVNEVSGKVVSCIYMDKLN